MKSVDLSPRVLQQFCVLAQEKHFGRAADRLYISQPSLSQAISRLEQSLGVTLLVRTSRAVELTPAGQAFAAEVEGILQAQQAAVMRARRIARGEESRLRLGATDSLAYTFVPALLRRCQQDLPHLQIVLQDYRYDELIERTKSGHVDVAIMYGPLGDLTGLSASLVTTEPIMVALSADHRLAQEPHVAVGDLADEGFALPWTAHTSLVSELVSMCEAAGFTPRQTASANTTIGLIAHVASGSCVAFVPSRMRFIIAPPEVVLKPLVANRIPSEALEPPRSIQTQILALTRAGSHDPAIDTILKLLQDPAVHRLPEMS
ncbi:LysR family transcriptional regulator [Mycobacteroides sp. PCS013]|uniref:LysR family transcriptional regulator n=1 Tax=Mycobacteroides sp. PCS013 TaxID=3074106 RepID=UPI003C2C80F1